MNYDIAKERHGKPIFYVEGEYNGQALRLLIRDRKTNIILAGLWVHCGDQADVVLSYRGDGTTESVAESIVPGTFSVPLVESIDRAVRYAEASHCEDAAEPDGHAAERQPRLV